MIHRNLLCLAFALVLLAHAPLCGADEQETARPSPAQAPPVVAHVKLSGDLGDRAAQDIPFGRPPLTYRGLLSLLRQAEDDPAVKAILLEVNGPAIGFARAEGLRDTLGRLRKAGKKIHVFAESLSTVDLVFASAADRIAMPETGVVLLPGVMADVLYLKGLFSILGIDWLVVQEKEYKSALESFVRDHMSPQLREVLEAILDQYHSTIVESIARGRRISPERVGEAIDSALLPSARARELGLIDAVEYRHQLEESLRKEMGAEVAVRENYGRTSRELDMNNPFALLGQIMKALAPPGAGRGDAASKVGLIYAEGVITEGKSRPSPFGGAGTVGSETLVKAIGEAAEDPSVKAIVLRVDSPGGSGLASDLIWDALMRAREKKPVVASMSEMAASGGYYIAMAAHSIVAQPTTITGSIGVIAGRPNLERLLGHWGVNAERLQRGKNAGILDIFHAPSDSERKVLETYVGGFYKEFVKKVARSRGLPVEEVEEVARGRVWTGAQAKERKLVDELGGLERALAIARERAGLPLEGAVRVVEYPAPPSFFEAMSELLEAQAGAGDLLGLLQGMGAARGEAGSLSSLALAVPEGRAFLALLWRASRLAQGAFPVLALAPFEVKLR